MVQTKSLGVWLNHSKANLIDLNEGLITQTIESEFTYETKIETFNHSESGMHHKEHQQQEKYYKKIGKEILNYNRVLLFGPTDAKLELHNYILNDSHFKNIKIDTKATDKMTDKEQIAFVGLYFKNKVL